MTNDKPNAQGGIKFDADKPMMSLIDPFWIFDVAGVLTFGGKKYGFNNWKKVERARYEDAILRHVFRYLTGEKIDPESGYSHMAHISCNSMFLHYFDRKEVDSYQREYRRLFFDECLNVSNSMIYNNDNSNIISISTPLFSKANSFNIYTGKKQPDRRRE